MTRPTTLKLHDFSDESFIHGCYIPDHICDDLIKYFDENPDKHAKGEVYNDFYSEGGDASKLIVNTDKKESTDLGLHIHHNDEDVRVLSEYIQYLDLCIREYEYKYHHVKHIAKFGITESVQIQKYEPGGGFKVWHFERGGIIQQTRCLVFQTYLNDVPDGGTEFMYQKIISPAKKGLTIIWPSDWTHTHKGQISQTQKKIIITGWLNYQL